METVKKSKTIKTIKILTWTLQILAALAFIMAGIMKISTPYGDLVLAENMGWAEDFSATQIKIIGVLEFLGAIGMILPFVIKKFIFLVPLAALGLVLVMVGAIFTHLSREEPIIVNIVLLILNLSVVYLRRDLVLNRNK
jgi:uncharacterized membrane protein YphA (DoxX/SURF4 family)|tara:strand:+ start:713 stop:1129 length:417 start_codon:yes stop_codon:yes gene_type:complete